MAKLHFYYSAMNAGKSTMLLQSSYNYRERGMDTLLFVPTADKYNKIEQISSRIGLTEKAFPFTKGYNLYQHTVKEINKNSNIKCVLVDEAQFLTKKQIEELCDITDNLNIPVLAYGLRSDFQGQPFEGSMYLMAWADILTELKTICHCGKKATMTLRLDTQGNVLRDGEQIEIGGNESYLAVCRKHFKKGKTKY